MGKRAVKIPLVNSALSRTKASVNCNRYGWLEFITRYRSSLDTVPPAVVAAFLVWWWGQHKRLNVTSLTLEKQVKARAMLPTARAARIPLPACEAPRTNAATMIIAAATPINRPINQRKPICELAISPGVLTTLNQMIGIAVTRKAFQKASRRLSSWQINGAAGCQR
jgi:hypothetical protein